MDFQTPDDESVAAHGQAFQTPDEEALPHDEGALAAAARGALRNFPLAQQAAAAAAPINPLSEKKTYSDELAHLTDAAESAKAAHPIAYGSGAVAGAAAPMLIPGVGEAMAASYPAAVAGNAGLGAAQALSDTSLTQDPGKAAKEAAIGAGIGAGTGALGHWMGKALPTPAESETGAIAQKLEIPGRTLTNVVGNDVQGSLGDIADTLRNTVLPDGRTLNDLSDSPLRLAGKVGRRPSTMYGDQIGGRHGVQIDEHMPVRTDSSTRFDDMATSTKRPTRSETSTSRTSRTSSPKTSRQQGRRGAAKKRRDEPSASCATWRTTSTARWSSRTPRRVAWPPAPRRPSRRAASSAASRTTSIKDGEARPLPAVRPTPASATAPSSTSRKKLNSVALAPGGEAGRTSAASTSPFGIWRPRPATPSPQCHRASTRVANNRALQGDAGRQRCCAQCAPKGIPQAELADYLTKKYGGH
jgi:hypothetical protein